MGDGAVVSTQEVERIGKLGATALDTLQKELAIATNRVKELSQSSSAVSLEEFNKATTKVNALEDAINLTNTSMHDFEQASQSATPVVSNLGQSIDKTNHELKETEATSQRLSSEIQGLKTGFTALTGALAALGIGTSAMEIAKTADEWKNLNTRVQIAVGSHGDAKQALNDVVNIAKATNSNLTATGDLYARLTKIGQEMKIPQQDVLGLTTTINQAIQVSGGSAESAEASITQLQQALASGVLRGDEFNSMMEQSPRLTQALADGLSVTTGQLRNMAGEGKLTTEVVTKALLSQSETIQKEFSQFPVTIGRSIENLKTSWTVFVGELDASTGISAKAAEALNWVAENLDTIFNTLKIAAQAFIAYKALNIASVFLDKATAVRAASLAITQETTAVIANTQAQLANNAATSNTSGNVSKAATSASGGIMAMIGRLGSLGIAITAIGVLVPTVFEPVGTAIGEGVAKLMGYGDAIEKLEQQQKNEAIQAKVRAELQAENNKLAQESINKSYGLSKTSQELVTQFNGLITAGKKSAEALKEVSESMKFDSTAGINNAVSALNYLQQTGKATAKDVQDVLRNALVNEDLVVFQTNAKAAFAGTAKEAEKSAEITKAVMGLALERTGLDAQQLQGRFSKTFQSASNDIQIVVDHLDEFKQQGIDTGLALSESVNKAINTAQTGQELDYAKGKLEQLAKQGLITGEQAAYGLSLIEQKVSGLGGSLNPVLAAFNALGIKTKEQLTLAAETATSQFNVVQKSGQATAEGVQQAYTQMLNSVIATGDKSQIAIAQAKAASLGLSVQIDDTGKATVQSFDEMNKAADNHASRVSNGVTSAYRRMGEVAREEALSSTEAWNKALSAQDGGIHATRKGEKTRLAFDQSGVEAELKAMGYDDKKAAEIAKSILSSSKSGDGYKNASKSWLAKNGYDIIGSFAGGGGGTSNANYVREQLEKYSQYSGSRSSANLNSNPTSTRRLEVSNGQQTASLIGSSKDVDSIEQMLSQFEMLKKSS
ncbi:phage tail tape measure protein [Acinetobacter wuhouensis]|nr:phage tail tape measure protein [Acinetobacter wuhouensis]